MSSTVRAALWMMGALLSFSAMALSIRGLAISLNIFEILAIRSGVAIIALILVAAARPALIPDIKPHRFGLHLFRNVTHFGAQYLWTWTVTLLPLATVFALEFTAPAWTAILAALFLGERMTPSRIGAIVLGITGVVIILRPGLEGFKPAALLVLAAAFGFAVVFITTKQLTLTEKTFAIVFWMNVIQFPISLIGSEWSFVARISLNQIPAVLGMGLSGLFAHYCLASAFRSSDATVVASIDFLRIPLIAILGWWLYNETLDIFVFIGAAIIVVGVVWNLRSEARRRPSAPPAVDPPATPGPKS